MKVIVIGGTGLIGSEVVKALSGRHEVTVVGHSGSAFRVDITSKSSIEDLYSKVGSFDALVSAAGSAAFRPTAELTDDDFERSLHDKLMGQINLVRLGLAHIRDNGSFTLTTGVLAREPIPGSAAVSMVNAALEGFARAAALDLGRGIRINVVSPPWAAETLKAMDRDPTTGVPAAKFAAAYRESVEGTRNGEVLQVTDFM